MYIIGISLTPTGGLLYGFPNYYTNQGFYQAILRQPHVEIHTSTMAQSVNPSQQDSSCIDEMQNQPDTN
jgi:hypothetical protein